MATIVSFDTPYRRAQKYFWISENYFRVRLAKVASNSVPKDALRVPEKGIEERFPFSVELKNLLINGPGDDQVVDEHLVKLPLTYQALLSLTPVDN